jgi:hypothetical protein
MKFIVCVLALALAVASAAPQGGTTADAGTVKQVETQHTTDTAPPKTEPHAPRTIVPVIDAGPATVSEPLHPINTSNDEDHPTSTSFVNHPYTNVVYDDTEAEAETQTEDNEAAESDSEVQDSEVQALKNELAHEHQLAEENSETNVEPQAEKIEQVAEEVKQEAEVVAQEKAEVENALHEVQHIAEEVKSEEHHVVAEEHKLHNEEVTIEARIEALRHRIHSVEAHLNIGAGHHEIETPAEEAHAHPHPHHASELHAEVAALKERIDILENGGHIVPADQEGIPEEESHEHVNVNVQDEAELHKVERDVAVA